MEDQEAEEEEEAPGKAAFLQPQRYPNLNGFTITTGG